MGVVILALLAVGNALEQAPYAERENPVTRVVQLINELKSNIEADGRAEQTTYDEFACWCEKTTARKAAAIADAKETIERLSKSILELNQNLGSYAAEIAKLKKDIAENKKSQTEATEMRDQEKKDYLLERSELEQAIANLEKAIKVIQAGTGGTANLVQRETDLMSVAAGIRSAMNLFDKKKSAFSAVSESDVGNVKSFLSNPSSLLATKGAPHLQEYQPASTQVQGILKSMYDEFVGNLQSSNQDESTKQKEFTELIATKQRDLGLLEATLEKKTTDQADDMVQLSSDKEERTDTQAQLDADEAFFEQTKQSCKDKANEWAERSRLRTEELAGINQAVEILTAGNNTQLFDRATSLSFVEVKTQKDSPRSQAYKVLKDIASKSSSLRLATIAASVQTTGHFDEVIKAIDEMIATLRQEEQDDVEHRDWCQQERHEANSKNEELTYDIGQLDALIGRLESKKTDLNTAITQTGIDIGNTESDMADALKNRNSEHTEFQKALKDDTDAVSLLAGAIEALTAFYSNNKLSLVAKKQTPEYTENPDATPETWSSSYGGRSSENTGIVSILTMIKEDLENEIKVAREEEAASRAAYDSLLAKSTASLNALKKKDTELKGQVADTVEEITTTKGDKTNMNGEQTTTNGYLTTLKPQCDWVERTFDTRRTQRQSEEAGLQNAKSILNGAVGETAYEPTLLTKSKSIVSAKDVDSTLASLDVDEKRYSFLQRH